LDKFFAEVNKVKELTPKQRDLIVQQAIMLLEGFYAHLPLKRAMYAVDPLQRLRLLRHRLPKFNSDRLFHAEMTDIFTSLRDRHTAYTLPTPFNDAFAWLPFKVESYFDGKRRRYLVAHVAKGFGQTVPEEAELLYWNGVPIARAVELAGAQSSGNSPEARHALGLQLLTARALEKEPAPDAEWVTIRYRTRRGREREVRVNWAVSQAAAGRKGRFNQTDQLYLFLFNPELLKFYRRTAAARDPHSLVKGMKGMPSIFPNFRARRVSTPHGTFGYIRIFSFDGVDPDDLVAEFIRLIKLPKFPRNGLIIDVRDNPGGSSEAAEMLLQLISPHHPDHPIVPQRLYFINTPLTLQLCNLQRSNRRLGFSGLAPWIESIQRSLETNAMYSASFPIHDQEKCNAIGRLYPGRVIVITSALSYSAAEFFAAGFQEHGGKILGVDNVTGGGGANVTTHQDLRKYFKRASSSALKGLPKEADLQFAFRRSQRVGPQIGNDVEDFGIRPNYFHSMTRNDILKHNVDLINRAASLLVQKSSRA